MPGRNPEFAVLGTLMHTPRPDAVDTIPGGLVVIGEDGNIRDLLSPGQPHYRETLDGARAGGTLLELAADEYLLPGLVDLHVHAPQWPQLGKALHLPLNDWLQEYTFPLEARYADLEFARRSYESLVDNLLANGTTTAAYFGSIHLDATCLLADIVSDRGQRAVVGRVAMDNRDQCPDFYRDASTAQGLDDSRALIEYVNGMAGDGERLVHPAVVPRFIPSCSDAMLTELGRMAAEYGCHVQTHCSESDWQHDYVLERHGLRDTQSLDRFGLLTERTVLAHAVLIDDADMTTIRARQSGVAHCPLSNLYFSHAVFQARRALDSGLKVGLGTDISGGPSASILDNCRHAINVARALEDGVDPQASAGRRGTPGSRVSYREAFWMATVGGARTLGLPVGQFAKGYAFDAIVVDAGAAGSDLHVWQELDSEEEVLQKIIYGANRSNIRAVWVQGRRVAGA